MRILTVIIILFVISFELQGQMVDANGGQKYGNEWINYSQEYYKIPINKDGIYRIYYQQMVDEGINVGSIKGSSFQIFVYGKEIPIYTSTAGIFTQNDFIEFYGEKNRSYMDYYLFGNNNDLFNKEYSMFNDDAAYFLTWSNSNHERYNEIDNDLNGNLPFPEQYYIHEEKVVNSSNFIKPLRSVANHVYKSSFDVGEGFGSPLQQNSSFTISASNKVNSSFSPELKVRLTTNIGSHSINVDLNNSSKLNISHNSLKVETYNIPVTNSDLNSNMSIDISGSSSDDMSSVSHISLKYSRDFDFLNKSFFVFNVEASNDSKYFVIRNFDIDGNYFVLLDVNNNNRIIPEKDLNTGVLKFIVPASNKDRKLVLVNVSKSVKLIGTLKKVSFRDFSSQSNKNYIIISDREKFNEGSINWVEEYASYRSSSQGGNFNTLIVDIDNIYDQFGYGIDRHSQSLNNFVIYVKDNFSNPEYIFIIGKGIEYNEVRTDAQRSEPKNLFHVPTFGYPGSDNLLGARFGNNFPALPIGRIAAKNYVHIKTYLDKVKSHENKLKFSQTLEDKEWMKKVIHLVGGSPDIIGDIRRSLKLMGNIVKDNKVGAYINTYERSSGNSQESVTQRIIKDIEKGAGIVTFNGHSGVNGTDFNIDKIKNERYPVFYSLGCYSGNIHRNGIHGQSEKFVLQTGGVIVYAGTSGTGFTGSLSTLGKKLYEYTGGDYYGKSIGLIVQKTLQIIGESNFSIGSVTLNQQFTFHGDPAVRMHSYSTPDYLIDYSSVKTTPNIINSNSGEFTLKFDVVNIGAAIDQPLKIKIIRKIQGQSDEIIYTTIQAPKYRETVSVDLLTHGVDGLGENCISIILDPDNSIDEQPNGAEDNNVLSNIAGETSYCFKIINNGIKPIYPKEYSIYNNTEVVLKASTYNYFTGSQNYIFQIDTSELFDSPLFNEVSINSEGGLITWRPNISFNENTVYYWRVRPEEVDDGAIEWKNSSFIYLPSSLEGWNQSHYYQYLDDGFDGTAFEGRKFDFNGQMRSILVKGKKYEPSNRKVFFVDGEGWGELNPRNYKPAVNITVWGPDTWFRNKTKTDYNSLENASENGLSFTYKPNNQDHVAGIKALLEAIPDSMTIFFYTYLDDGSVSLEPETWAQDSVDLGYNLYSLLESYGATEIRKMESRGTVPYVLIFKKGKGKIKEQIGESIDDVFELTHEVPINVTSGKFTSTMIGPVKEWNKILWQESNKNINDESYVVVYKFDVNKIQYLVDTLKSVYDYNISDIDASEFPYIKLEYFAKDKVDRNPTKIDYWRVLYTEYPDAVLLNDATSFISKDTMEFGDVFRFKSTVENASNTDLYPLLVKYRIKKSNNHELIFEKRYDMLPANSSYKIDFEYSVDELFGDNEFTVEINAGEEQKEQYYFNNSGTKRFYVVPSSLPMDLLDFDAVLKNDKVLVSWKTINEINCDKYIIEKSLDGKEFNELTSIISKDNYSVNDYNYFDENLSNGINYYRLKQIDLDGNYEYSVIINVFYSNENKVLIAPNPFKDEFVIKGKFNNNDKILLLDTKGRTVLSKNLSPDNYSVKINLANSENGIYFVRIINGNDSKSYKIIKMK